MEKVTVKMIRDALIEGHKTETYSGRLVPSEIIKIRNRSGKFYLTVATYSWPLEHEQCRRSFEKWLGSKVDQFGWKIHLTSGGCGEWTYRINSDLF